MAPPTIIPGSASGPFAEALARETGALRLAVESKRFADGELYVRLLGPVGNHALVVQSTPTAESLIELILLQDAARESGAKHVTTVVPYFGYARQDRAFQPGEPLSARAVARAVGAGCDDVVTVDPHKPSLLSHFGVPARMVSAVPQIASVLKSWGVDTVLAPDKGARDRAEEAARLIGAGVDHLEKTRISSTEVVMKAKALDVRGKRVAIVDDLIASGGTMVTAAKHLKAQGAASVVAACTHGLFTGNALPRLLDGGIDRVLCTDTLLSGPCNCDVVSAAPAVAAALRAAAVAR